MARKARLEHWRLTGISPATTPPEGEKTSAKVTGESRLPEAGTAFLSSLPLFRLPLRKNCDKTQQGGIQLTWPPPPLPHSPCPSSATTTPVTPTLPTFPAPEENGGGHDSPKCFGHQRVFQWPIPAVKSPKSGGGLQRNGSFNKESFNSGLAFFFFFFSNHFLFHFQPMTSIPEQVRPRVRKAKFRNSSRRSSKEP